MKRGVGLIGLRVEAVVGERVKVIRIVKELVDMVGTEVWKAVLTEPVSAITVLGRELP